MRKQRGVLGDSDLQNGVRVAREKPGFDSDPYFDLIGEGEGEMDDVLEVSKMEWMVGSSLPELRNLGKRVGVRGG